MSLLVGGTCDKLNVVELPSPVNSSITLFSVSKTSLYG